MNALTANILTRAEIWLCITTLIYFLMNGAQIFETFVIVPKWTASPPESLHYFKGKYSLDLKTFWIIIHSIHEITFILAIVFCWKSDIRNPLLILFAIHFLVRVWTILYFAPNVMEFQKIANTENITQNLINKAALWRNLNYIRVGIFLAVSIGLIPLCMKALNLRTG
jgi:hypothetical protein